MLPPDPPDAGTLPGAVGRRRQYRVRLAHGRELLLGPRTLVMGVLNVTPDSFSDGGLYRDPEAAVERALQMEAEGADLIDVGGETTRPGAAPLPAEEEWRRVVPVVERLATRLRVPVSVDTYKAPVADAALSAGAAMVNDISGLLYDGALAGVVARHGAALIVMHMRGRPADMYREATYRDVVGEVAHELAAAIARAEAGGVRRDAVLVDPGIGFAKRAEHSWRVLAQLDAEPLAALDRPLVVGPSRKSFLTAAIGEREARDRDWATAAAVTAAVLAGVHIVRVHCVAGMVQVVRVADRVRAERTQEGPAIPADGP